MRIIGDLDFRNKKTIIDNEFDCSQEMIDVFSFVSGINIDNMHLIKLMT